jgi:parallel beta-helix repeat protein
MVASLLAFCIIVTGIIEIGSAATIYVPDDYTKIQWAVDNASAGDTIVVRDGVYIENIDVKKSLTIMSENSTKNCIVKAANSSDHVFEVAADYVTISGFTIKNATDYESAGIYLYSNNSYINNNIIEKNNKGIFILYANNTTIIGNNISHEDVGPFGDGIYAFEVSNLNIENNYFLNSSDEGVQIFNGEDIFIISNYIFENGGDGIQIKGKNILVINNSVLNNRGYGIYLITGASDLPDDWRDALNYSNNYVIENNTVSLNRGDGIYLGRLIRLNDIISNTINSNQGNGIEFGGDEITYYEYGKPLVTIKSEGNTIKKNIIYNNSKSGIKCLNSEFNHIYLNDFVNNTNNTNSLSSTNIWVSPEKIKYTYNRKIYTNHFGNYWSDYNGSDADWDGIGDTPYSIDGYEGRYPLMERFKNYFVPAENYGANLSNITALTNTTTVGVNATYYLLLTNNGTGADTYNLAISNPDSASIASLNVSQVYLDSGASHTIVLNVTNASSGVFRVNVTATSTNDTSKYSYVNTTTTVADVYPPIAFFTYAPQILFVNETITFNASSSHDPNGFIVNYTWNFGDVNTTTTNQSTITHVYSSAGNYTVTLTVVDNDGLTNSTSKTLRVQEQDITPPASITNLHNTSYASDYITWAWSDPADADFSHVMVYLNGVFKTNVSKGVQYYNATGLAPDTEYMISTRTSDVSGNVNLTWVNSTATTATNLPANQPPVADCGPDKLGCENVDAPVQFNASASFDPDGSIVSYEWDFGDGGTGTGVSPKHKYATYNWNGTAYTPFTVTLTVTDDKGATDTDTQQVIIWIAGDANGDGTVNIIDAATVGLNWGSTDPCADLNNDNNVNIIDAATIGLNWGDTA